MSKTPRILVFAGSARAQSFNKRLAKVAAAAAREAGAEVTYVDLRDLPMPLYDQDLEEREGLPPNARAFKELLKAHDGMLIAAPENNSSVSALLKNVIDWASRREGDEPSLAAFKGKVAALVSASPGALGGLRGLFHAREILANIGVVVLPEMHAVSRAHEAFAEDGSLKDLQQQKSVEEVAHRLVEVVRRLHG